MGEVSGSSVAALVQTGEGQEVSLFQPREVWSVGSVSSVLAGGSRRGPETNSRSVRRVRPLTAKVRTVRTH